MHDLTERFEQLVRRDESELPLDEAALLIAAHAHPDLDVRAQRARLDALAEGCPEPTLEGLRRHLFEDLGFTGDTERYHDPRNSYLDHVLDQRRGIPITLSVVTLEVGRRLGIPLAGVGMPGHFLVRHLTDPPVFVDPFGGGQVLDQAGCEQIFHRLAGAAPFEARYLDPVGPRAILSRMLANLQGVFLTGDLRSAAWVLRLRLAIPDRTVEERRHMALALASIGRFDAAAAELDRLADLVGPEAGARLERDARSARARMN
jgi:regulator of sirC expression with transglutaminase-like and TPR domain